MESADLIQIPSFCLVILIGASGSGKSTFARTHFKPTEVISSDTCRGLVSDDEINQAATADAFALVRYIARIRLKNRLLTVIDATNVKEEARKDWKRLSAEFNCPLVAIILDLPEKTCIDRNALKPDRQFGAHVIPQHISHLTRSLKTLPFEGYQYIMSLSSEEEVNAVAGIERIPASQ